MSAHCLLKVATKVLLEVKSLRNLHFRGYFSKTKTMECNQSNSYISNKLGTFLVRTMLSYKCS